MTTLTWVILILVIFGIFAIVPAILKLFGFGFKIILKFIGSVIILILIAAVVIFVGDTFFGMHWWTTIQDWFQSIGA